MKRLAKAWLASGVAKLPWGVRDALLRALSHDYGEQSLLIRLAAEAGITGFIAPGQCGRIQSAASDRRILLEYARAGAWAECTTNAFVRFFAGRGGTYLDIGANIGLTTLPVARNPDVRCIAFEPEPTNFANLTDNIRRNAGHGNVALHPVALFDRDGTLAFSLSDDGNLGDHRVTTALTTGPRRGATIDVRSARLDDLVPEPSGPLAVKLDAQGAEPFIIAGGQRTLRRAELVVLEFSPMLMTQLGGDAAIVIDFLAGFDDFAVVRGDSTELPAAVQRHSIRGLLQEVLARGRADDRDYLDVHAMRRLNA